MNIGILGMGTVATGLMTLLSDNKEIIERKSETEFQVTKVLVKDMNKKREVPLQQEVFTSKIEDIIDNEEIHLVVELIGGIHPAYEFVKKALKNGKHVVTANKALIATYGEELEGIADENGVYLRYEASVAGGIPIINTLKNSVESNEIKEIMGIVNGTTNYILTQMSERGLEFEEALKEAQDLGFAEADPSSDIDGDDAMYKIAILSYVAFGQPMHVDKICKEGITRISKEDIQYAKELGYTIKLVATARKEDHHLEMMVYPALLPMKHPIALAQNEYNAVVIKGNGLDDIMLYGKGAGALPTGSSVLNDMIEIAKNLRDQKKVYNRVKTQDPLLVDNKGHRQYYIRLDVIDKPGVMGQLTKIFGEHGIGLVSVSQLKRSEMVAPLVFITYETDQKMMKEVLCDIKKYSEVLKIASILAVES